MAMSKVSPSLTTVFGNVTHPISFIKFKAEINFTMKLLFMQEKDEKFQC
jgi:hypothetical protein